MSDAPLVIVGSGMAGNQLLKQLRKLNSQREVVVICEDSGDFYSKPMLSNALKQNKTPAQLCMQTAAQLSVTLQARYQIHTQVLKIDRLHKQLVTTAGIQFYDQCVLAIGAKPRVLPWLGDAADQTHAINDWQAYAHFRKQLDALLQQKKPNAIRIAVIGAGLVGCEFANDLRSSGVEVVLFSPQGECLFPVFPPQAGIILRNALQHQGIHCWMPTQVTHLEKAGDQVRLRGDGFADQIVDLVISAVGLISSTHLASSADLETDIGICVNAHLQTNDEHIFALGDCAQINGKSMRYILPIMSSAQALAQTLNGVPTAVQFPWMPILLKTPACPMLIAKPNQSEQWQWQGSGCDWVGLCHDDAGHLSNFVVTGNRMSEKAELLKRLTG